MTSQLVIKAINFAAHKHEHQRRKDKAGTPYINHPIAVMNILSDAEVADPEILAAAVLHDTVEDTNTTIDEIKKHFGINIAKYVSEVTDDKDLEKVERKKLQIAHAAEKSFGAKLIKLADKLANLTDLTNETPQGWSEERVTGYFVWAWFVIKGLRGTNESVELKLDALFCTKLPTKNETDLKKLLDDYYNSIQE